MRKVKFTSIDSTINKYISFFNCKSLNFITTSLKCLDMYFVKTSCLKINNGKKIILYYSTNFLINHKMFRQGLKKQK